MRGQWEWDRLGIGSPQLAVGRIHLPLSSLYSFLAYSYSPRSPKSVTTEARSSQESALIVEDDVNFASVL